MVVMVAPTPRLPGNPDESVITRRWRQAQIERQHAETRAGKTSRSHIDVADERAKRFAAQMMKHAKAKQRAEHDMTIQTARGPRFVNRSACDSGGWLTDRGAGGGRIGMHLTMRSLELDATRLTPSERTSLVLGSATPLSVAKGQRLRPFRPRDLPQIRGVEGKTKTLRQTHQLQPGLVAIMSGSVSERSLASEVEWNRSYRTDFPGVGGEQMCQGGPFNGLWTQQGNARRVDDIFQHAEAVVRSGCLLRPVYTKDNPQIRLVEQTWKGT